MNNYATNVVNNSRPFTELPERFMYIFRLWQLVSQALWDNLKFSTKDTSSQGYESNYYEKTLFACLAIINISLLTGCRPLLTLALDSLFALFGWKAKHYPAPLVFHHLLGRKKNKCSNEWQALSTFRESPFTCAADAVIWGTTAAIIATELGALGLGVAGPQVPVARRAHVVLELDNVEQAEHWNKNIRN